MTEMNESQNGDFVGLKINLLRTKLRAPASHKIRAGSNWQSQLSVSPAQL